MKKNNNKIRAVASVAFAMTSALSITGTPLANAATFQGTSTMADPETGESLLTESGTMTTRTSATDGHGTATYVSASTTAYASGEGARVESDDADGRIAAFDTAIGHNAKAIGSADTAIGAGAEANSMYGGTAIGTGAVAKEGQMVTAVGFMAKAEGNFATAYGANANAAHAESVALGANAQATNEKTTAIGTRAQATSWNTTAVGTDAEATGDNTIAIGANTRATAMDSTAVGTEAEATDVNTSAYGRSAAATKENATALGTYAEAKGLDSTAIGVSSIAGNDFTTAIGDAANVTGIDATGVGQDVQVTGADATGIGSAAIASGEDSVAVGTLAKATNIDAVAIGFSAEAASDSSMAIGTEAKAKGENSLAIGAHAQSLGLDSVAIGTNAKATVNATLAMGANSAASGDEAIAIGDRAKSTAEDSIAFGSGSSAKGINSVALGNGSVADEANTVSVGKTKSTRRITNVTAGVNDTDAVNVSQLKEAISNIDMPEQAEIDWERINTTSSTVTNSYNTSILGGESNTITNAHNAGIVGGNHNIIQNTEGSSGDTNDNSAIIGGSENVVSGDKSVIIGGHNNKATADNTYVLGGHDNIASGTNSVAIGGTNGTASGENSISMNGGQAIGTNSLAFGYTSEASKDKAIALHGKALGKNTIAIGTNASAEQENAIALNGQASGKNSVAIGSGSVASKEGSLAMGNSAQATAKSSTAIGALSVADEENTVSVGSSSNARRITNVHAGIKDTDAVNVSQLKEGLAGKADINLGNISVDGQKVIEDIARSVDTTAEVTTGDSNLNVTATTDGNTTSYDISMSRDINVDNLTVEEALHGKGAATFDGDVTVGGTLTANGRAEFNKAVGVKGTMDVAGNAYFHKNVGIDKTLSVGGDAEITGDVTAASYGIGSKKYVTADGVNANSQKVVNVADGSVAEDSKDAVNGGQLYATKQSIINNFDGKLEGKANVSLDNITNEGEAVIKNLADEVDDTASVKAGSGNVTVSSEKNGNTTEYTVDVAKDLDVNSINAKTVNVGGKTYISEVGINANSQKITNVADGKVAKDSKDAVNGGQLYAAITEGVNVVMDGKADIDLSNITNEGETVIRNLADEVDDTASVKADDDNLVVTSEKDGNVTTYGVKLADDVSAKTFSVEGKTYISDEGINANSQKVVNVADGSVAEDSKDAVNGGQLYATKQSIINNFDGKLEGKANVSLDNITNEGEAVIKNLADEVDDTASVKAGSNNITVSSEKNGNTTEYTVDVAKDLDVNSINAKTVNVGGKTYISEVGINANSQKITNVADGKVAKDSKDAVNGGQLYAAITEGVNVAMDGKADIDLSNITNEGETVIRNLADEVDDTASVKADDDNLVVTSEKDGNVTTYGVKLADDVSAKTFSVEGKTYISDEGINANSQKVVNVADGKVAEGSKDAVNGDQLYATKQSIINNFDGKLEGKANVSLDNITNEGEAVIKNLADEVDDTASVKAGSGNVTVSSEKNGNTTEYTVDVAKDLDVNSINAKTVNVGGKTYISETGINANSQKVVNVADGTIAEGSKDAVNGGQLYSTEQNITNNFDGKLEGKANVSLDNITNEGEAVIKNLADEVDDTASVKAGSNNITVSSEKNGNTTEYTVDVAKDLDVNSINAKTVNVGGKTYISEVGINANSQKITNVADGKVAKDSKDAVNGGQLYAAITEGVNVVMDGKADIDLGNITNEGETVIKNLADSVDDTASVKAGSSNVTVSSEKNGNTTEYTVDVAKDLDVNSINAKTVNVGGKTYISEVGINANSQKITNVADGKVSNGSKDAVNGGQLYQTEQNITNNFNNKLDGKANVSLDNITNEGQKVITDLADSVDDTSSVKAGSRNVKISSEKDGNNTEYTVDIADDIDVSTVNARSYAVNGKVFINEFGINANGLKVTNVADGAVEKGSKDAVNGGQLYDVKTQISDVNASLDSKANISLDNITSEGKKVITDLADSVDDTAEVASEDENIEIESEKNGNTTIYKLRLADNIEAKSFSVGGNVYIDGNGINANSRRITNVANGMKDTDAVNMGQLRDAMMNASTPLAVLYDSEARDVVTLAGSKGTTITNVKAGEISKTSTDAVNGSQLYATNQKVETNIKNISELQEADKLNVKYTDYSQAEIHLGGNGGTRITNVAQAINGTDAVNLDQLNKAISEVEVKGGNDKNAVHYTDDTHKVAKLDGEGGTTLTGVADGEIAEDSQDAVNGSQLHAEQAARKKADKELGQRIDKETEERKAADKELGQRIDKETEERKAADEALSERIGYVSEGDHSFISSTNNVAQNLEALDKAILVKDNGEEITIAGDSSTKVINVAGKGGEARVITGVATDPSNGLSAANVDYVNSKTNEAKDYANGIGAQAAAMSALHPLDWEQDDKVSVSASVGTYKSEVAGAVGAFYRPDKKSMISVQGSFGSNDNMIALGVSKKLGKTTESSAENVSSEKVVALQNEVSALREQNASIEAKYQQVYEQNQQILAMLAAQTGLNLGTVGSLVSTETAVQAKSEEPAKTGAGVWNMGKDGLWHNSAV